MSRAVRVRLGILAAVLLAVLGEASAVGLVGVAGWFLVGCAVAGAVTTSTFSWVGPGAVVRALALTRVGARYSQRLLGHDAMLRRLAGHRLAVFDRAARTSSGGSGLLVDRAMVDTEVAAESLVRVTIPGLTAAVVTLGTAGVIAWFSPYSAVILLLGALAMLGCARATPAPAVADADRGAAREEIATVVDAWPELASLPGGPLVRARVRDSADRVAEARTGTVRVTDRIRAGIELLAGLTVAAIAVTVYLGTLDGGRSALILLLALGATELWATLPDIRSAQRRGMDSGVRLRQSTSDMARPVPLEPKGEGRTGVVISRVTLPWGAAVPVDETVASGAALVLCGRSGVGKTTLLHVLGGEVSPATGTVTVHGGTPAGLVAPELVQVAHDDHVFTGTVAENLRLADPELRPEAMRALLAAFGLAGLPETVAIGVGGRELSTGERRRLALARAVAARPRVLLLDEPVEGLDEATAEHAVRQVRRGLPDAVLVLAVHDRQLGAATRGLAGHPHRVLDLATGRTAVAHELSAELGNRQHPDVT